MQLWSTGFCLLNLKVSLPYNIQTLLKKGERDLIEPAVVARLGNESRLHLSEDIKKNMQLYNNIEHLIWETELNIIGKEVSIFLLKFEILINNYFSFSIHS